MDDAARPSSRQDGAEGRLAGAGAAERAGALHRSNGSGRAEARRDVMAATNQEDARDAAAQAGVNGDPLPSWREGASRQAILDFVERVTTEGGPDAVPLQERIAVFDNDGTLWCEKPMPIQLDFILRRLVAMAEQDPALRTRQPWQAAYDKDYQWLGEVLTKHYHGDDSDVRVLL